MHLRLCIHLLYRCCFGCTELHCYIKTMTTIKPDSIQKSDLVLSNVQWTSNSFSLYFLFFSYHSDVTRLQSEHYFDFYTDINSVIYNSHFRFGWSRDTRHTTVVLKLTKNYNFLWYPVIMICTFYIYSVWLSSSFWAQNLLKGCQASEMLFGGWTRAFRHSFADSTRIHSFHNMEKLFGMCLIFTLN